ncbi:cupin domain-containing protein [Paenibacillus rigui]|uniref:Cupin type-1 domain-containing protein n=1 Tax=Paenibacillus rigui TaxID=554312 RepID=A0A229UWA2_9BACL|nr:cupin domain-containing protein [Paenibacillus rigui]OXM87593.1 hypothetical protein CF651_04525 [Paenibacillus rigui]
MISYMDYTSPNTQFFYDLSNNTLFRKDAKNYINALSIKQLNTLGNNSLLDIFLSAGNVVEPHYHQNAAELVYCITGAAVVSLINPFTNELLHYPISPGQVANVPQGWWHYEVATVDSTHLLAIFDAPIPEVILGSDILRLTPPQVLAHTYCLNEAKIKDALAPLQKTTFIGPPSDCKSDMVQGAAASKPYPNPSYSNLQPNQQFHLQPNQQPVQQLNLQPNLQPNPQPNQQPNQSYPNRQPVQAYPNPQPNRVYANQPVNNRHVQAPNPYRQPSSYPQHLRP